MQYSRLSCNYLILVWTFAHPDDSSIYMHFLTRDHLQAWTEPRLDLGSNGPSQIFFFFLILQKLHYCFLKNIFDSFKSIVIITNFFFYK